MKSELDQILQSAIDAGSVPGVAALVVDRDGVVYEGAAGERAAGSGVAMTVDSVGAIYSMTKALTATAVMIAVEEEALRLDTPVAALRPELGDVVVLDGWAADGQPITRPPRVPITVRHLLTHTSGFTYDLWNADTTRYIEHTGMEQLTSGKVAALRQPLAFDPGERWEYGIGLDWAGLVLESAVGVSLGRFMEERIFEPLGMADTAFRPSSAMSARAASMHVRDPQGGFLAIDLPRAEKPEFEEGGGGLRGSMPDYGRFLQMILRGGELDGQRVLRPGTVDLMAQNHIGDLRVQMLPTTNPAVTLDAEFFPGTSKTWGLSWQIDEQEQVTGRPAGTLMWAGLSNCFFWIDRSNGLAGCFMSQLLPFADERALGAYYDFEAATYAAR